MELSEFDYGGLELEIFQSARCWRRYWMGSVREHLGSVVLEVGAGIGTVTRGLCSSVEMWTALEPDPKLCVLISESLPKYCTNVTVVNGRLCEIGPETKCDSILYIDVLEHIEDDRQEVIEACRRLKPGGKLIILVPAHQSLFSSFDAAIGHYRRYKSESLESLRPSEMNVISSRYLDSVGYLLSWANARLLSQSVPTKAQITFWDRFIIPLSRVLDRLLGYRFGKSLLVVWQAPMVENGS